MNDIWIRALNPPAFSSPSAAVVSCSNSSACFVSSIIEPVIDIIELCDVVLLRPWPGGDAGVGGALPVFCSSIAGRELIRQSPRPPRPHRERHQPGGPDLSGVLRALCWGSEQGSPLPVPRAFSIKSAPIKFRQQENYEARSAKEICEKGHNAREGARPQVPERSDLGEQQRAEPRTLSRLFPSRLFFAFGQTPFAMARHGAPNPGRLQAYLPGRAPLGKIV